jgi:hypothetical protein
MTKANDLNTISARKFATGPFLIGIMLLLCALIFYYFAVLKIDYNRTVVLDLDPILMQQNILHRRKHYLRTGGLRYALDTISCHRGIPAAIQC